MPTLKNRSGYFFAEDLGLGRVADVAVDDYDFGELVAEIPQRVAEGVACCLPHCQSGLLAERRSAR